MKPLHHLPNEETWRCSLRRYTKEIRTANAYKYLSTTKLLYLLLLLAERPGVARA